MSSVADYLAKNYLNADKPKKKKSKKSKRSQDIVVEDVEGPNDETDPTDMESSMTSGNVSAEEGKQSGWKRLDGTRMSSGARAGLQTAEQVARDVELKHQQEMQEMQLANQSADQSVHETVYRDASGRRIDLHSHLEDQRRQQEQEKKEKEEKQRKLNLGLVQQEQALQEKKRLREMKETSVSRYADDEELNDHLRQQDRLNDPGNIFIKKKRKVDSTQANTAPVGLQVYKGAYEPNRFNIPPGAKWDGVDRSNGFESKWFRKQNELREKKTLSYTMATDDI
uniref:Pre-mRNA-splicing factor CWC26 n=1 Tax=Blastobotrys adeninivorans TaxID=409370 RepID=A0A060TAE0_BLAAD